MDQPQPNGSGRADPETILGGIAARLRAAVREKANLSLSAAELAEAFGKDREGRPLRLDALSRLMLSAMEDCKASGTRHLSIVAPPELGKSTLGRLFVMAEIGRNPKLATVAISADMKDACRQVSLCRDIAISPEYQETFPGAIPDMERSKERNKRGWRQDAWFLIAAGARPEATMMAKAAIPRGQAIRTDILLADDVMTEKVAREQGAMETLSKVFFQTWVEGRLGRRGWCLYLQNVWDEADLGHQLREEPKFCSLWIGVRPDYSGMFVRVWNPPPEGLRFMADPAAWGLEPVEGEPQDGAALEFRAPLPEARGFTPEAMSKIQAAAFLQLYALQAASAESRMFPSWPARRVLAGASVAALHGWREDAATGLPVCNGKERGPFKLGGGLDISGSGRAGCAWVVLSVDAARQIRPVEVDSGAWTIAQMVARIDDCERRGTCPDIIFVECNATQELIAEGIAAQAREKRLPWWHRVRPFLTGRNKSDPQFGLPALDSDLSAGRVEWPGREAERADTRHFGQWRALEGELSRLTRAAIRKSTPDRVMAYWFARSALNELSTIGVAAPAKRLVAPTSRDAWHGKF